LGGPSIFLSKAKAGDFLPGHGSICLEVQAPLYSRAYNIVYNAPRKQFA
jgi:hypothetical protein